jgi:cytochrome P450
MTINSMILGLLAYPRVVKKAQEELDRVVGSSRFPIYGDEKNLPYIRAIVKEVSESDSDANMRFFVGDPPYITISL